MLLFNGLHIMLNLIAEVSFLGDVADTISSILISRFIINLREVDSQDRPSNETTFFNQSSHDVTSFTSEREGRGGLVFAENFVESMGAPLDESCASSEMSPEVEEGYTRCDVKA
ncbi:hypothetical protein BD309DRAFT_165728 [Dichomitus squalens]|uniref:Uncharacterized protein n=1 Tax=Dichomitus squalens TaxID=114155 RepID=A0A4Q9PI67_9APHY|nr:hypothetical protein BD309DRAFT_165728 [Dichomitus squalens]TBU52916.1 hypothetical protein BD310DRAFT_190951 [Dichomitus squalens]